MCSNDPAGRFNYRALNGTYAVEEPLCDVCAGLLTEVGSVVSLRPAADADTGADAVSLMSPFGSLQFDAGNDPVG